MIVGYIIQSVVMLSMIINIDWQQITEEALIRSEQKQMRKKSSIEYLSAIEEYGKEILLLDKLGQAYEKG